VIEWAGDEHESVVALAGLSLLLGVGCKKTRRHPSPDPPQRCRRVRRTSRRRRRSSGVSDDARWPPDASRCACARSCTGAGGAPRRLLQEPPGVVPTRLRAHAQLLDPQRRDQAQAIEVNKVLRGHPVLGGRLRVGRPVDADGCVSPAATSSTARSPRRPLPLDAGVHRRAALPRTGPTDFGVCKPPAPNGERCGNGVDTLAAYTRQEAIQKTRPECAGYCSRRKSVRPGDEARRGVRDEPAVRPPRPLRIRAAARTGNRRGRRRLHRPTTAPRACAA